MFLEPTLPFDPDKEGVYGWTEVIAGSMFSGKTEELIRRLNRARIAGQKVEIFKPKIDKRYHEDQVVSHNRNSIPSRAVDYAQDILLLAREFQVIGIDEAQFFDDGLPQVCHDLANQGKRVIIAGLDMDYAGVPFGPMPHLLAMAEFVTKVHAICVVCGNMAHYSFRKSATDTQVMVGEKDLYEPRCRKHFEEGLQKQEAKKHT